MCDHHFRFEEFQKFEVLFAMRECDGRRRGCWAYAAERPGFSIVKVLFTHTLCSRRKNLAMRHISSALRRGGHLVGQQI